MSRDRSTRVARRGLTLIELTLALTITVVIGAGLASVLAMVSQVSAQERDARTASLRAHAAQIRLQAYTESALCALQTAPGGDLALWLEDADGSGTVNLTELRVVWTRDDGTIVCERVSLPDAWTDEQRLLYDVSVPAASDFFAVMRAQRKARMTTEVVIVDGVTGASLEHDAIAAQDAQRLRFRFTQSFDSGQAVETLVALALAGHETPEF